MKTHWILSRKSCLHCLMVVAVLMLASFGCTKDDADLGSFDLKEDKVIMSEDHWVNPEGTKLIALDGSLYLDFDAGTVTEPTLFTIASVELDDEPAEEFNTMNWGISITNNAQDPVFGEPVTIRLNYTLEAFQKTSQVNEKHLTIYKVETIGTLSEREVSIGECCVDCSCNTVQGCISEGGLYVVGELYIVCEI